MTFTASRVLSAATAGYGVYCLVIPDGLAQAVDRRPSQAWRRLAYVYGVRDLLTSAAMVGPDRRWWRAAMGVRLASDVTDAVTLGVVLRSTPRSAAKVVAVAGGWGVLNALAWRRDEHQ